MRNRLTAFVRLPGTVAKLKTGKARLILSLIIAVIVTVILIIVLPYRPTVIAINPQGKSIDEAEPVYVTSESPRFVLNTDTIVREAEKKQQVKKFQAQVGTIETVVLDSNGNETTISPQIESSGSNPSQFTITLPHIRKLVPGRLQLKVVLGDKDKKL